MLQFKDYIVVTTIAAWAGFLPLGLLYFNFPFPFMVWHQVPAALNAELIVDLHHYVIIYLIIILAVVSALLLVATTLHISISRYLLIRMDAIEYIRRIQESEALELIWTIVPSLVLLLLVIPSVFVLYVLENPLISSLAVFRVVGHQWFWSYQFSDVSVYAKTGVAASSDFDSYMVPESSLNPGDLRLLEVDNPLNVPATHPISFLVTSDDVLHSWAVPSLGFKIDAIPGRINQIFCSVTRPGEFYGQCSELCGVNHGFMPIKVIAK